MLPFFFLQCTIKYIFTILQEIAREHVTFKCGGVTILPTDTPLSCDLFEGDIIDVCFTLD